MNQHDIREIKTDLVARDSGKFAIAASRFNHFIVDRLVDGAFDCLDRHGVDRKNIVIARVPGSFELPWLCQQLAMSQKFSAVIALGAVIRGATTHYDHVASEVAKGCAHVMLQTQVPICFGVVTTDTIEQAIERAGTKAGNKGWDAALSALEMSNLRLQLNKSEF